jgi:IMP dehydrogenase
MKTAITFDDVLLVPQYSEVTPDMVNTTTRLGSMKLKIPIISAPMDTVTESPMVTEMNRLGGLGIIHKNMTNAEQLKQVKKSDCLNIGVAVSPTKYDLDHIFELEQEGVSAIVIDSAHGHSLNVMRAVEEISNSVGEQITIIAGNVATAEGALDLVTCGADVIKVGIGPGSICTTRIVAGVGVPQVTAIMDVYEALNKNYDKGYKVGIIADGGIRYSGDVAKALAAGADAVMLGSLLAGHDESPGELFTVNGKQFKSYRGMGSEGAMNEGSADRYNQDGSKKFVPEGIEGSVPYKGKVEDTIYQLVGGIKSAMGYCGDADMSSFVGRCSNFFHMKGFVGITPSALVESHPHNLAHIKESSNYVTS